MADERQYRILLAEDDEDICAFVERSISRVDGYIVEVAQTGEEAVRKLLAGDIDFAILDYYLPGKDAVQIMREVKAVRPLPPLVVSTGMAGPGFEKEMLAEGAIGYIPKPIDVRMLLQKIANVLKERDGNT